MTAIPENLTAHEWPDLDRLDIDHPVELPLDHLPTPVRNMAAAVSRNVDVDPAMPALVALGALAAVVQKTAKVQGPKPGWREQLSLFVLALANVSEHKSPTYRAVMGPLYGIQDQLADDTRAERQMRNAERDVLDGKIAEALSQSRKGNNGKRDTPIPDAAAIAELRHERELLGPTEVDPRLFTDDTTTQKATAMMAANGGRLTILSPEAAVLHALSGNYSQSGSADLSPLLSGYSGDPIFVDRMGRNGDSIPNPALTLVVVGQPAVLGQLKAVKGSEDRGLMARFVMARITPRAGARRLRGVDAGPAVEDTPAGQEWAALLGRLARRPVSDAPPVLRLSPAARDHYERWYDDELEPQRTPDGGRWSPVLGFAGKACGLALRLSGLFHLAQHPDAGDADEIQVDTVTAAIGITEWALAAHLAANVDEAVLDEVARARRLVHLAERGTLAGSVKDPRPWAPFTKRDAQRILTSGPNPVDNTAATAAVEVLTSRGYVRGKGSTVNPWEWHPELRGGVA